MKAEENYKEAETELLALDSALVPAQVEKRKDISTMLVEVYEALAKAAEDQDDQGQRLDYCIQRGAWNNKLLMFMKELEEDDDTEDVIELGEEMAFNISLIISELEMDLETQ